MAKLAAHTKQVSDLRFSQDGRLFATSSEDTTIKIWDVSKLLKLKAPSPDTKAASSQPDSGFSKQPVTLPNGWTFGEPGQPRADR